MSELDTQDDRGDIMSELNGMRQQGWYYVRTGQMR